MEDDIDILKRALYQIARTSTTGCKGLAAARIEHMKLVAYNALQEIERDQKDDRDSEQGPSD